ncbi:unnamed protein product [Clavelina lepadiformis]|uniref:Uncharacterized protein n=1 Tax=Clavelina lepadiformis TaxID=159417 RepID=A0ABP0GI11_CLALP
MSRICAPSRYLEKLRETTCHVDRLQQDARRAALRVKRSMQSERAAQTHATFAAIIEEQN